MNASASDYFGGPMNYAIILILCVIATFGCIKAFQKILNREEPMTSDNLLP